MRTLKLLFAVSALIFTATVSFAQESLDSKGFTVQTYLGMYMEDGEVMSYDVNEIYNISLQDGFLVHNILKDNLISDSQLYKISKITRTTEKEENKFAFDATSGLSGNVYRYEVYFDKEGGVTLNLTQPNGDATVYLATSGILKTFKQ